MKPSSRIALAALLAATMGTAGAAPTIVSSVGGAPTAANRWNLDSPLVFPSEVALIAFEPDAAFVTGSASGLYAAPFLSGNNGTGFGAPNQANGQDTTQYVTTGSTGTNPNAKVRIQFKADQRYFGLLWGSVDTYNTLSFLDNGVLVGTVTGSQVNPLATGDQGANGTFYVNINVGAAYDQVVFTSSQYAFEFDNIAFSQQEIGKVPEPASLALVGLGLLGLGATRRRRAAR